LPFDFAQGLEPVETVVQPPWETSDDQVFEVALAPGFPGG
jgi:hypothetical protein